MIQRFLISAALAMLAGCSTTGIKFDANGNIEEVKGKFATAQYMQALAMKDLGQAAAVCQPAEIAAVAELSATGQSEYYRAMDRCFSALSVAAARDNALTPHGEVALANSRALAASERASSEKTQAIVRGVAGLGIGYIVGSAIESGFEAAQGDTYTVGNVSQSTGRELNGVGGAEGGSVGNTSNGSNVGQIHIGRGDASANSIDGSPSSMIQPNQGGVDKPQAFGNEGPATNHDDDGENEASLLGW